MTCGNQLAIHIGRAELFVNGFLRFNGTMLVALVIFVVVAALALSVVALFLNEGRPIEERSKWVKDSVQAWRDGELEMDAYQVELKDAKVNDVFSTFEAADGDGYLSFDELETTLKPVTSQLQHVRIPRREKSIDAEVA
ncbi:MAG: hypothetical protein PUK59_04840 [Actinomycetaceae bacterium]|nr:hypothetical protein [Actinomycetaceae bacterium]MDY5854111.1 hypothetical protein [Arcanobacterium sp.]